MSVAIHSIQQVSKWLEENSEPRAKDSWLLGSIVPVTIILIIYLAFVLKIGPEFMRFRQPINIDRIVTIYNVLQILFLSYLVTEIFRLVWLRNDCRFFCIELNKDPDIAKQQIYGVWLCMLSKYLDLFDTVFFVLRKKQNQVTFLHVYHHTMIVTVGWLGIYFRAGGQLVFFMTINACVHIIMYTYYLLTIVNPEYKTAWWKKYLTIMQLVQFVIIGIHFIISLFEPNCNFPHILLLLLFPQAVFMFILFYDFYRKAYTNKQSQA